MTALHEGFVRIAHDPGDPMVTAHCPFCGSGQVFGRSDGNIECDFCGQVYIVRVQPAFSGMPQSPEGPGAPTDIGPDGTMTGADPMMGQEGMDPGMDPGMEEGVLPPGLPGEEGEEGMPPGEEEDGGSPFPPGDDDSGGGDVPPPPEKDKDSGGEKKKDKKGKNKKASVVLAPGAPSYLTAFGDNLPEEAFIRHLAVLHSGGSPQVMAALRRSA